MLLLWGEVGGKLDVEEDEEVPFLGRILGQRHAFIWYLLEVLGTEMGQPRAEIFKPLEH